MRKKGKELEFISWIRRDGSGTDPISNDELHSTLLEDKFKLKSLSITLGTYIACGFNCYVVKLKKGGQQ